MTALTVHEVAAELRVSVRTLRDVVDGLHGHLDKAANEIR